MNQTREREHGPEGGGNWTDVDRICRELIGCAKAGDRAAANELVRITHDKVFQFAWICANYRREDAEDLAQDAFCRFFDPVELAKFDPSYPVITSLCKLVRNKATSRRRLKDNRLARLKDEYDPVGKEPSPVIDIEEEEREKRREQIQQCVSKLHQEERHIFFLRCVLEMPYASIASDMNVKVTAITMRIHRIRRKLQTCLRRHGVAIEGTGS